MKTMGDVVTSVIPRYIPNANHHSNLKTQEDYKASFQYANIYNSPVLNAS